MLNIPSCRDYKLGWVHNLPICNSRHSYFTVAAQIEDDIATGGTEKQNISVVCTLSGAEDVNNTIDLILYQWIKNNGSQTEDLVVSNSNTLSFSLLEEMDFGQYTCKITVNSSLLIDGTATIINTYDIGLPESKFLDCCIHYN